MPITPNDIKQAAFSMAPQGYAAEEVDEFLDRLAHEVDHLMKRLVELKSAGVKAEGRAQALASENAALQRKVEGYEQSKVDGQLSETQLSEVFVIAKQTADHMISEAQTKADGIVAEAELRGREAMREAMEEHQRELDEIDRLQQSRAQFCSEYQSLLKRYLSDSATQLPISDENLDAAGVRAPRDEQVQESSAAGA